MNKEMLKYLVELSGYEVDAVDTSKFFQKYPDTQKNCNDLKLLANLGLISILNIGGEIEGIGVNQKALNYFK